MPSADTPPDVQRFYDELWRRLTPAERFQRGIALILTSRAMAIAGLRARFPMLTDEELRLRLRQQLYGV